MTVTGAIGLMGPFGYGNLGDAAIVEAAISRIRRHHPDREIRGFTLDPEDTRARHGIESFPLSRMSWDSGGEAGWYTRAVRRLGSSRSPLARKFERVASRVPAEIGMLVRSYRSLRDVDTLIICGSGQIQDYWGGGGPWSYPYTMLRWSILARLQGAKVMVLSTGAGPVDARLSRRFFRWALELCAYRSYRDEWSRRFVADEIGLDTDDPVYPDLAFDLPVSVRSERADGPDRRRLVGIGPMGYFRDRNWPERDDARWAHYRDVMVRFVGALVAAGHDVMFLKGEAHFDQPVIDDITAEIVRRGIDLADHLVPAPITTVEELVDALDRCDVVVASRFHNILIAYLLGRPALGISYQAKTDSLMAEYSQSRFCVPIHDIDAEALMDTLNELFDQPDFVGSAKTVTARKRAALDEQYEQVLPLV